MGAAIADRIEQRPLAYWAGELEARRIAWSPVLTLDEVAQDPHMVARGLFDEVRDAAGGSLRFIRQPLKFSSYTNAPAGPVPSIGEANSQLLAPACDS